MLSYDALEWRDRRALGASLNHAISSGASRCNSLASRSTVLVRPYANICKKLMPSLASSSIAIARTRQGGLLTGIICTNGTSDRRAH